MAGCRPVESFSTVVQQVGICNNPTLVEFSNATGSKLQEYSSF